MHRADADDHADVRRRRSRPARRSGRLRASPSRAPAPRCPAGADRISSGSPISVLKLAREATVRRCGASSASSRSLVEVLPVDPVTPITCASSSRRQARGEALQRGERVLGGEQRAGHRASGGLGVLGRRQHPPRAGGQRLRREPAAVGVLAPSPTNSAPGPASRESMTTRSGPALLGGRADEPGAGRPRDLLGCPGPHALIGRVLAGSGGQRPGAVQPAARTPSSASRATVTSSNGILRPPSNSWPCSWPLPAITTTSPGRAPAIAVSIAARRSASCSTAGPVPTRISSMIASGILGARVVGGDDHAVGQPRGDLAHQRPLAAVAVAAAPEHDVHGRPRRLSCRGRAQDVLERVGGVGVVDEHGELLAGVDRLEAARDVPGGLDRARPRCRSARPAPARRRARRARCRR